jgi:hypothetical protein
LNRAQLLPSSLGRSVGLLLRAVAAGDPVVCTTMLTPAVAAQLAAAGGVGLSGGGAGAGRAGGRSAAV